MSKMIVRPPQFWANPFGNPAEDYNVYVGVPNYDPRQEQYQLAITDGVGGPIVSNPFKVNKGLAKNANGELITPVINQQEYSLFFESPSGGGIEIAKFIGDGLSSNGGGSGGGIPDLTINNLDQALQTDLSTYNFVFIKSENSGWEGSANGPSIVSFYYRDGTTGAASSGDENKFFDLSGNGWSLAKSVIEKNLEDRIDAEIENIYELAATTQITAQGRGTVYAETRNFPAFKFEGQIRINNSDDTVVSLDIDATGGNSGPYSLQSFEIDTGAPAQTRFRNGDATNSLILGSSRLPQVGDYLDVFFTCVINKPDGVTLSLNIDGLGTSSDGSVTVTPIAQF